MANERKHGSPGFLILHYDKVTITGYCDEKWPTPPMKCQVDGTFKARGGPPTRAVTRAQILLSEELNPQIKTGEEGKKL
jgi:hypothetical protein